MSILDNEITTSTQADNGTRMFLCKRTGARYGSYTSGYVRREIDSKKTIFDPIKKEYVKVKGEPRQYYLNKRKKTYVEDSTILWRYTAVKINSESERLELIKARAEKYDRGILWQFK